MGGEETHLMALAEIAAHTHGLSGHSHTGAWHTHTMGNHVHNVDHYHTWDVQAAHAHGLGGHTHGGSQEIRWASVYAGNPSTGGIGPYQFLFTLNNGTST